MKISKAKLKQIIKEELSKLVEISYKEPGYYIEVPDDSHWSGRKLLDGGPYDSEEEAMEHVPEDGKIVKID